jgi:hypothetical protein
MTPEVPDSASNSSDAGSTPTVVDQEVAIAGDRGASSGPTAGTTGTGIAAYETGFGESGSLPDTAAPPAAR